MRLSSITLCVIMSIITACSLGLFAGYGIYRFGSIQAAMASAQGEEVIVDQWTRSLGEVRAGTSNTLKYVLTNMSINTLRLLGSKAACSCTVVGDFQGEVQQGRSGTIQATVTAPSEAADINGGVEIFTSDRLFLALMLSHTGRAVSTDQERRTEIRQ